MQAIFDLYQKYFEDKKVMDMTWKHVNNVLKISRQFVEKNKLKIDWETFEKGCLLHDIGTGECLRENNPKPYLQHALLGAMIVRAEGFHDKIAKMVERHTGAGLTKEEIEKQNLPLPRMDFLPETVEERLLAYADKFDSKTKGGVTYEYRLKQYENFGHGPVERLRDLREEFGLPDFTN